MGRGSIVAGDCSSPQLQRVEMTMNHDALDVGEGGEQEEGGGENEE